MKCGYCDETDESRLAMRSSFKNGEVKHEWVCLSCLQVFILPFVSRRKDGKALSERKIPKRIKREEFKESEFSSSRLGAAFR
jgi:hypothetical protein